MSVSPSWTFSPLPLSCTPLALPPLCLPCTLSGGPHPHTPPQCTSSPSGPSSSSSSCICRAALCQIDWTPLTAAVKLWYQLYQHHHGFLIIFLLYFDKEGEGKVKGAKRCELCHQWALSVQWGTICGATINFNGTNHTVNTMKLIASIVCTWFSFEDFWFVGMYPLLAWISMYRHVQVRQGAFHTVYHSLERYINMMEHSL